MSSREQIKKFIFNGLLKKLLISEGISDINREDILQDKAIISLLNSATEECLNKYEQNLLLNQMENVIQILFDKLLGFRQEVTDLLALKTNQNFD